MAREIEVTSDRDNARSNMEFIEYWFAAYETPKDRRGAMERTVLRIAGLDKRTVVGMRRKGRGSDFLDVYLVDIEGRRQLGTVDLLSSIVDAEDDDLEAVVAKSGAIFQQRERD